jgi:hypothetical protein
MFREPIERLLSRSIQEQAALVEEEDATAELERAGRSVLRKDDGGTQLLDLAEKPVGTRRVEL